MWGIAAAIVLQAAVFGFMHMNWVQGCYAGAAGLIFGWVLVTTGKLRYTILLHFAFNAGDRKSSVQYVARKVGISNMSFFNSKFKEAFGETPGVFRTHRSS